MSAPREAPIPWRILWPLALFAGVLALVALLSVSRLSPTPPDPALRWQPPAAWDPALATQVLARADALWQTSLEALDANRPPSARRLADEAHALLAPWRTAYPQASLPDGTPFEDAAQTLAAQHRQGLTQWLDPALDALAEGRQTPRVLRQTLDAFADVPALRTRYEARRPAIQAARTVAAPSWFRVVLADDPGFEWLPLELETAFRTRFAQPPPGIRLVFGGPLSAPEKQATWQTLVITTLVQTARFRVQQDSSFRSTDWQAPTLPLGLELHFQRAGSPLVPTSWDTLAPMYTWVPPPPAISKSTAPDFLDAYQTRLRRELRRELEGLPSFRLRTPAPAPSTTASDPSPARPAEPPAPRSPDPSPPVPAMSVSRTPPE